MNVGDARSDAHPANRTHMARYAAAALCGGLVILGACVGGDGGGDDIIDPNPVADTIGPAGGALTVGEVELLFPPNAVAQAVGITVREATTFPASPLLVAGTVYELRPSELQFAEPVQLTIGYDPGAVPAGVRESELRLYRVSGLGWQKVSGSVPDEAGNRVSAEIGGFSVYGVLGVPVASVSISPPVATIGVGETVQLTATPEDAESLALPEREVIWTTSDASVAEVDASGLVTGVGLGTVSIRATSEGQSAVATVTVAAAKGNLQVTTATSGEDQDPDGYTVLVDGSGSQPIGLDGVHLFENLAAGNHTVELTGVASNCAVQGDNPRTVAVPEDGIGQVAFTISCTQLPGDLRVLTETTGESLDLDGYTVTLDGGSSRVIETNGEVVFTGLVAGNHTVELSNVASNCTVSSPNPRTIDVPNGGTAQTTFAVTCETPPGNLEVTTSTSGPNQDSNGYVVTVDGGSSRSITVDGQVTFTGLSAGSHTVELTDVAANCAVSSPNPRTVSVPSGGTVQTTFEVTCSATTGDLQVNTSTTGQDLPSGYTVVVDGSLNQAIGISGTVTFTDLAVGEHSVQLTDVPANCSVTNNPRTVNVTGGTTQTAFTVTCSATTGNLEVTTSTSGQSLPSGYMVVVDGNLSQAIGINGTVTFTDLAVGEHSVQLNGAPSNCTVSDNPRTVNVTGGTTQTMFTVTCAATTGNLEVTTSTSGQDLPTGYTVVVDGSLSQATVINGTVTFTDVAVGDHSVQLNDVPSNCTVSNNPRTVTVIGGQTVGTTFSVSCAALVGDLQVSTATTGDDLDPNGYTVTVDGGASQSIQTNGQVTFSNLSAGSHTVELTGVAANCTVSGSNPRNVNVLANQTVQTTFSVSCEAILGDLQVNASTSGESLDPDGYIVTVDGGSGQPITIDGQVTFTNLSAGSHSVALTGVAANCTVSGENPRSVNVPAGDVAQTTFDVTCAVTTGDLEVSTATSGGQQDPNGYQVVVDDTFSQDIGNNDQVVFLQIAAGSRKVHLKDISGFCKVSNNPRMVNVPAGGTGGTLFDVQCKD